MKKTPVSLIIDDSGVVNMAYFHNLEHEHELLIPPAFAKEFASVCRKNGIKGKFSVIPIPGGLGRLDRKVSRIPAAILRSTLRIIKNEIEPVFSITPEILTHFQAYDVKRERRLHILEDYYFANLTVPEVTDYVSLALEILVNIGLNPTGVTSPWSCGINNERNYAEGIGRAFRRVMKTNRSFYFLHSGDDQKKPVLMCDSKATGKVVSIPNNTFDPFGGTMLPAGIRQARLSAREKMDLILSPDGKTGIARERFEQGLPIILISHWQRLFADGRKIGLEGLDVLTQRINRVFGNQIEWMTFQEIMSDTIKNKA